MAVHQPSAWVVRLEGDSDEAAAREKHDVPPGRVGEVERLVTRHRVERRVALREDYDVRAVPVERMRDFFVF